MGMGTSYWERGLNVHNTELVPTPVFYWFLSILNESILGCFEPLFNQARLRLNSVIQCLLHAYIQQKSIMSGYITVSWSSLFPS